MQLLRIRTDTRGESYWETSTLELQWTQYAPPAAPLEVTPATDATRYVIVRAPHGWHGSPHCAPRRQLCVILDGRFEITTSDGETRRFGAGERFVMEDTSGKGHTTRNTGSAESVALMVHLD